MIIRRFASFACLSIGVATWAACSSSVDGEPGTLGDDQNVTGACEVFSEIDQRPMTASELEKLGDPVAKLILSGTGCPKTFQEIQAKLRKVDTVGCDDKAKGPPAGVSTRFVSERSQLLGTPDSYRAVVSRKCGERAGRELMMSLFGIRSDAASLPSNVELIGEDKTRGVFDYYAREDGKWKFFGNSADFVDGGYTCDANGACTPKAAKKTRCASCHTGGGLVMKELNSPWLNWEGSTTTPGTKELVEKHSALLGIKDDGIDMEQKVIQGNGAWTPKRIELLRTKSVAEVLRPLFCTIDINLDSRDSINSIQSSLFLDPKWGINDSVPVTAAAYKTLIAANGQRMMDSATGKPMKNASGPVTDTFFALTYPRRSDIDTQYVKALVDARPKIVDEDFVRDVLFVDFTRPVFSKTRCDLLDLAPTLDPAKISPDAIRDGFKASLAGKKLPGAAELLASLNDVKDATPHRDAAKAFIGICQSRPKKELLADVLVYASHLRTAARAIKSASGQGIMEFPEGLAFDDVPEHQKFFDPATCVLK